jgi:large subunit ribosomal protein L10
MARPEKEAVVNEFRGHLSKAQGVYVADYKGLNVEQVTELRAAMRKQKIVFRVAKNTLVKRALREAGQEELSNVLVGPNAFIFGFDDPVAPARVIKEFKTKAKLEKPAVRGFALEGKFFSDNDFAKVADLPGKKELVARVVGSIQAPLANFVFTLNGIIREFVGTVDAIAEQKKGAAQSGLHPEQQPA